MEAYISNFKMGIGYLRPQYLKTADYQPKQQMGLWHQRPTGFMSRPCTNNATKKELPSDFGP